MRRGVMNIALEEREEEVVADNLDVAEAIEESPEVDMTEAVEAAGEVAAGEDQIEQGMAAATGIERITEQVEGTLAEGGASPEAAEMARVAVESLLLVIGGGDYKPRNKMPAMEAFELQENRVVQTKLAVESFKETAKKVWDTIVAAIKRAIAAVKQFFTAMFASGEKVAERAEKLAKLAESKKGGTLVKDAKVSIPSTLSVNGKLPAPGDFDGAFTKHSSLFALKVDRAAALGQLAAQLDDIAGEGQPTEAALKFAKWTKTVIQAKTTELVFGGKTIEVTESEKLDTPWSAKLIDSKVIDGGEIGAMTPEQCKELADRVHLYAVANFVEAKKKIAEAEKAADALIARVSKGAQELDGKSRVISSAVNSAINLTTKLQVALSSYDLRVVVALEGYIAGSLNKVEKAKAAKEEKKA